ncbi:30S ribosomal protein S8 [endosymbiont of Sipalinus gigas]|uniref:30S ribosomal protein S8 n=1 Tax=endosymbiont of Sipalinus gigas TaxID=1972134 RepID=UPI000DC740FF|nr:30S ribosomal protein S8 [endosymbiont of Sipalinus gigas]BBA85251.1 30S ribosomal protein S8 [endosymbiont of Sipalinus gigas]
MNNQDPISEMFNCIKNAQKSKRDFVSIFKSKIKLSIIEILKKEGFIKNYNVLILDKKCYIKIFLKYFNNIPVIEELKRISKPSLRIYTNLFRIKKNINKFGIFIISTSKGIMTDYNCCELKLGGELICYIS